MQEFLFEKLRRNESSLKKESRRERTHSTLLREQYDDCRCEIFLMYKSMKFG
jgi:hypothetical protein